MMMYIGTCVCARVCMRVRVCVCVKVWAVELTQTHRHTDRHTDTHTHTQTPSVHLNLFSQNIKSVARMQANYCFAGQTYKYI